MLSFCLATVAAATVPVVTNDAVPTGERRTLELEELWRIGGEDDEDNLLGVVDRALADEQGNVYLLDIQLVEVLVFGPDGQYLRSVGKQGSGPGEIQRVADLLFLPDGTVGLVQPFPGKIVKVDLEGLPAGELRPGGEDPSEGGFFALRGSQAVGGHLALSGARMTRNETSMTAHHFVALFDTDGNQQHELLTKSNERQRGFTEFIEKNEYFPHRGGWALSADGRVAVAPQRNAYRLQFYGPGGELISISERKYDSWRRTKAERERAEARALPFRRRNPRAINVVLEPTERDILQMRFAEDGRLWVLPSRGIREQSAGVHSTWDIFDQRGEFVEQVSLACAGDGRRDAVIFVGHGLLILVKEHEDALTAFRGQSGGSGGAQEENDVERDAQPLEVICYRITS